MNPKLLILSLLGLACTITGHGHGKDNTKPIAKRSPIPTDLCASTSRSSGTQADGQVSVGNLYIVINDELRKIINDFNITREEIKHMLERYAKGDAPIITKEWTDPILTHPTTGTVSFRKWICKRPNCPITSSETKTDRHISVGNIQIVINDKLRKVMRDYNITREEIKHMLERYAKGGTATITKERVSPTTGMIEIVTLDLKEFISQRSVGPITSVSPTATSLSGGGSRTIDSIFQPNNALQLDQLLSKVVYLQKQIKLLDVELDALNDFYRQGVITREIRNKNAVRNRNERIKFLTDLLDIQMEISRMTGSENTEPRVPQINKGDDEELFES